MAHRKVSLSFSRYTDADLLAKALHIMNSLANNPAFANPIPSLAELQAVITEYNRLLIEADTFSRPILAQKNAVRRQLQALLVRLGMYVMFIADGNEALLTSSGFALTKQPERANIANPGGVTLSNGITSGQLVAKVKLVRSATSFLHEIAEEEPTDNTRWQGTITGRTKHVYNGLTPGKKYWIRIAAVGRGQQPAYSPVASQFVQ